MRSCMPRLLLRLRLPSLLFLILNALFFRRDYHHHHHHHRHRSALRLCLRVVPLRHRGTANPFLLDSLPFLPRRGRRTLHAPPTTEEGVASGPPCVPPAATIRLEEPFTTRTARIVSGPIHVFAETVWSELVSRGEDDDAKTAAASIAAVGIGHLVVRGECFASVGRASAGRCDGSRGRRGVRHSRRPAGDSTYGRRATGRDDRLRLPARLEPGEDRAGSHLYGRLAHAFQAVPRPANAATGAADRRVAIPLRDARIEPLAPSQPPCSRHCHHRARSEAFRKVKRSRARGIRVWRRHRPFSPDRGELVELCGESLRRVGSTFYRHPCHRKNRRHD